MLENWLRPLPKQKKAVVYKTHQLGSRIERYTGDFPNLKETKIALIGIGEENAQAVRAALYQLSFPFSGLHITDLGNLRKEEVSFIIPVIKELVESKICPILIGSNNSHIVAQYQAYQTIQPLTNLIAIDEHISYDPDKKDKLHYYLNPIIHTRKSQLFHLGVLGYQGHFANPETIKVFERRNFEHIRLGKIRNEINEIEPIIRDGDLLSFNINVLKQSEAPAQSNPSPSGLVTEEACQLTRYAGMSDKMTSIGFYGYQKDLDTNQQTAQVLAQMIWYFLDGFYHRKQDYPVSTKGLMEYIVHFKKHDYQLTFWKSNKSSRWWMQVPVKTQKKHQRHRLIPCSYRDYQMACQEDLPQRLWTAFKRFS